MIDTFEKQNYKNKTVASSLNEYLTIVESAINPDIIEDRNWQNIKAIADIFPRLITNFFGFEYRLSNKNAYSDFLLCIDAEEAGKKILGDVNQEIKLPANLIEQPEWQHLINFGRIWCEDNSPIGDRVSNMWLEFDLEPTLASIPIPSVFFGLLTPTSRETNSAWVTDIALPQLLNRPVSNRIKENVDRCFTTLPYSAHVFQIGLMLSRQIDAVRLCIRNLKPNEIIPWLQQMGWHGKNSNLAQLLTEVEPLVDRIDLDIDVGESIYPKIGLECYLFLQPSQEPKWALFLEYLVGLGLCTAAKQHKLLNYPGYVRSHNSPHDLKLAQILGSNSATVFFNGLHHIKLSYQDRVTEAKAYLYVSRTKINVPEFKARAKAIQGANKC